MKRLVVVAICLAMGAPGCAAPFVAYVTGLSVHSGSPGSSIAVADLADGKTVNVSEGLDSARWPVPG